MGISFARIVPRLNASVDWFIPPQLKRSRDTLQAVRMFLFSHLLGPLLGHTITLSMLFLEGGKADLAWWILFAAITAFWPFAFVLRWTGWYVPLALLSIQDLMFCIFWGCYQYGGISSPILPWLVTVPLLAFFYLPERSTRIVVTVLIAVNLAMFYGLYSTMGFRVSVAPHGLAVLGLVSMLSASAYVSMMALYFANIVYSQGELEQEAQQHKETERKLRDATGQAQRALHAKSQFLAKMSHELKNPLNAIIGYSEILIEDIGDAQTQERKDLDSIRSAGHRLLGLINDLLELARLEAGKVELRLQHVVFAEFIEAIAARWRPAIEAQGNRLVVHTPSDTERMDCDPDKLRRVVEGVLSNAAKFTKNGTVTLTASVLDGAWQIAVEDTGVGIQESRMASLFETFGKSEDETASRYGDEVRLGLPLAWRYCQAMGGALAVRSQVGIGSTVTVTLPRPAPGDHERTAAPAATAMQFQAA